MLRAARTLLSLLVLASGAVGLAPSAQAAGGSLGVGSGVIWSDCRDYHFTYSLSLDPGTTYWNLDTRVLGPDGLEVSSAYLYSSAYPSTGTSSFQVCGGELPGRWALSATMQYDVGDNSYTTQLPVTYFEMRLPQTRTNLKASDKTLRQGQTFTFTIKTSDERPTGSFATQYADVRLQRKQDGTWVNVKGSKTMTNSKGVARLTYRWKTKGTSRVRAQTMPDDLYAGSTSAPLKLVNVR